MNKTEARALVDQIAEADERSFELRCRAYLERAWEPLGYSSWDELCKAEFPRYKLSREQRAQEIEEYRKAGLSTRAIASAMGVGIATVVRAEEKAGVPNGTPENPAPPRPHKVVGRDGKTYRSRATSRAATAASAVNTSRAAEQTTEEQQAAEGKRYLAEARALQELKARYDPISDTELARQENIPRRTLRVRFDLLKLPPHAQAQVETGRLPVKIAEWVGNAAITEEHMAGLIHKILAGKAGGTRDAIEQTIKAFAKWPYPLRSAFCTEPDLDYAGAVERKKQMDRRDRERRALEAAINSREKSATRDMLREIQQLQMVLIEVRNKWGLVASTPALQENFALLAHDVMAAAGEILELAGEENPVPSTKPVVIDAEPTSKPSLRIIDGDLPVSSS